MFLLVRDEDVPTVASAINAFADEEGLEPVDGEAEDQDPLAMLSTLTGLTRPRALVVQGDGLVAVMGLETLDVADADEWATILSRSCTTEVIALEVADDGVRVAVFDEGELDEELAVPLDPSGRTRAPALAELTDFEDGGSELTEGVTAASAAELAAAILRCFGVATAGRDTVVLSFVDPLDDADADEGEPRLEVQPLGMMRPGAGFTQTFAVTLHGADAVEGLRIELSGDALDLVSLDAVTVVHRLRGAHERVTREAKPDGAAIDLPDAYLESLDGDARGAPDMDLTDMFSTMQRLVSAGETQQLNTLVVSLRGARRRAGPAALTLTVSSPAHEIAAGQATVALDPA